MNGEGASSRLVVIDSISPAIERTKAMLFGPIVPGMWLRFGVVIFFEGLRQSGGGNVDFGLGSRMNMPSVSGESVEQILDAAYDFLTAFAPIVALIIIFSLPIVVGLRYLSCRAEVILVRGCAAGATSLTLDWRDTRAAGNSLFRFHLMLLALGLFMFVLCGALLYAALLVRHDFATAMPWIILAVLVAVPSFVFIAMAESLTRQFVSPLMVRHNIGWREAWGRVGPVLLVNVLPLIGYYLLKIVFWMVTGFAAVILGCATLCIGFVPIIQQTLLAPLYVFERNWSMVMLHYLGPGFEVFYEAEPEPEPFSDAPWAPPRDDMP